MKPDFSAIKDIQARTLALLDYTANFYNLNNRAINDNGACCYYATDNSPGCAIGQHCPKLAEYAKVNHYNATVSNVVREKSELLPDWMREIPYKLLSLIQHTHDDPIYWNNSGLSELGITRIEEIKNEIIRLCPTPNRV